MDETTKNKRNIQAVLDWCKQHREDLGAVVEAEKENPAFVMLLELGFEAGRQFQNANPTEALYPTHSYETSI